MDNAVLLSADPLVAISQRASLPDPDPLDQVRQHLAAVASADRLLIVCGYHATAAVHWIGGPVHGSYSGIRQIAVMWERLLATCVITPTLMDLRASLHPRESMVTADLLLGSGERLRYSGRLRRGLLLDEVWRFGGDLVA